MKKFNLNRTEKGLVITSAIILILAGSLFGTTLLNATNEPELIERGINLGECFDTVLEVTAYDQDGNVKDHRLKVGDLVLTNFAEVFRRVMSDVETVGGSVSASGTYLKSEDSSSISCWIKGSAMGSSQNNGFFSAYSSYYPSTYLAVGTGAVAPNVGDTDLGGEVFTKQLITADAVYSNGNVTFYGSIPCTDTETITEAGIYKRLYYGGSKYVMFIRDTFSGISVVDTDTVICSYTLILGEGYTDNFGKILEKFFIRYQTSQTTISLVDYAGAGFSSYCLGAYSGSNHMFDTSVTDHHVATMLIGTGSTAPARDDYSVETQVESWADASTNPIYENNINYTTHSTWQVTDDRSITEAGFFISCEDTSGTDRWYCLFRDTFSTQAVSNGREFTVTFKVYYNVG